MKGSTRDLVAVVLIAAVSFGITACSNESSAEGEARAAQGAAAEHATAEEEVPEDAAEFASTGDSGEHGGEEEGGEHGSGEEGEESGERIGRAERWDATRNGARLVLSFDAASNAFVGTVENTTERTLCAIRVEVHLSSGTELGPTQRTDVAAGATTDVRLPTGGEEFSSWTAHPEMSSCAGG